MVKDPNDTKAQDDDPTDTDHTIPHVSYTEDTAADEPQFSGEVASPSVKGEEDPFSGDASSSESPDIDDALKRVGLKGDSEGESPEPLGIGRELDEEV
jgi:hypothetical protein